MEILLAILFGAAVGGLAHVALPNRRTRGVALAPMIGALTAAVTWLALTWAGATIDQPWIWLMSIVTPIAVTIPAVALIGRARTAHDDRERQRLRVS